MSVSEKLKEEGRRIAILECLLALMKNMDWDVEQAMDAIKIAEYERYLYRQSTRYALEHEMEEAGI